MAKVLRIALMVFGALFLLLLTLGGGLFWFKLNIEKVNTATRDDVAFIFNWSGLRANQKFDIKYSYESPRSFLGDHLDVYCLQLSDVSISESGKWVRGPEKTALFAEARRRAMQDSLGAENTKPCFKGTVDANSDEMLAHFEYLRLNNRKITDYTIFLLHMPTKRLLAVDFAS